LSPPFGGSHPAQRRQAGQGHHAEVRVNRGLSVVQARRVLKTAKGERLHALYVLALCLGLRRGELLGLRVNRWFAVQGFLTTTVMSTVLTNRAWRRAMHGSANLRADLLGMVALPMAGAQEGGSKPGSPVADFVTMPGGGDESGVAQSEQVA
jgi:hypothetical protein